MDSNNLFSNYFSDDLDSSPTVPTVVTTTTTTTATWWLEEADHRGEAVLYTVSCNSDFEAEILLHLRKEENPHNNNIEVSTHQYAFFLTSMLAPQSPLLPHPNTLGLALANASLVFIQLISPDANSTATLSCILGARSCSSSRIPASARFASFVATQQSSSGLGGLFGWLTGDRSSSLPSLDFPLLGVILPPSLPNFVAPGKTIITTLPNGLKVASETSPVNEQLLKVKAEIGEASKNPQDLLLEAIHSAGFSGALANPLLASESALNRLNGTILEEFVTENYIAPRIVLVASGVEHEELLFVAEPLFSDLPSVPRLEEPKSVYTGGDYRCQSESGRTHFALAVELPGGWHKLKDAMVLTILQVLIMSYIFLLFCT
ncbi:Mitochondrial-processing peptidase subunit alpha [Glycine max]|nr:Mitochondrial-processing peptidase subunit alpha [Glycine max]